MARVQQYAATVVPELESLGFEKTLKILDLASLKTKKKRQDQYMFEGWNDTSVCSLPVSTIK